MAQRTVALCNGKYIGIESIYTVINGQQINIPDKLKGLREKSHRNELFCPCGCGANLILVAGDRNLREQHFREKVGTGKYECIMPTEGKTSVDSKIVLKCWLDDKLKASDLESRVAIDTIEETKRKPEFTFLSKEKKFAIRYWRSRANIMDDKLEVLHGNLSGINTVYIVDCSNSGTDGQYPEALMKLQEKQGFCLLLEIKGLEYKDATLKVVFYSIDLDGLWSEIEVASDKLSEFDIIDNHIYLKNVNVESLLENSKKIFFEDQAREKDRRIEEERIRAEQYKRLLAEQESKRQEMQRQRRDEVEKIRLQKEMADKRCKELEIEHRKEAERIQAEKDKREADFKQNLETNFSQQETQVRDADGNRWIKCDFCGKIAKEGEFSSYGGAGHINLGTCKECSDHNPAVKEKAKIQISGDSGTRKKYDPMQCPDCGGRLRERSGPFGRFCGCANYPTCRYSRPIKK